MTSATASSIRSAGCVESSAAMISESDVERNVTPGRAQLGVQLDGVDEVAVVGERDLALVGAPDRLRVLPRVRAGGRVADVPDRHVAAQRAQLLLVEDLVDEALVAHRHDVAALGRGDARGLLAAVLERVEGEVRQAGDIGAGGMDAEHSALVARAVTEVDHDVAEDSGAGGVACPDGGPIGPAFPARSAEDRVDPTRMLRRGRASFKGNAAPSAGSAAKTLVVKKRRRCGARGRDGAPSRPPRARYRLLATRPEEIDPWP